jgi:hypothetical protein
MSKPSWWLTLRLVRWPLSLIVPCAAAAVSSAMLLGGPGSRIAAARLVTTAAGTEGLIDGFCSQPEAGWVLIEVTIDVSTDSHVVRIPDVEVAPAGADRWKFRGSFDAGQFGSAVGGVQISGSCSFRSNRQIVVERLQPVELQVHVTG